MRARRLTLTAPALFISAALIATAFATTPAAAQRATGAEVATQVIGHGTPASCTSAAVVRAVVRGGFISFNCGPKPVTIVMRATAKVRNTSHQIVLNGGSRVTLSGAGVRQILYMNTCDPKQTWTTSHCDNQQWPQLIVKNITLAHGNSPVKQSQAAFGGGGGGAIFDRGGQLTVINSRFVANRCYRVGPDLGGAAIRALEQWRNRPVVITHDTFSGGRCSNGGAISSIGVSWLITDSVMVNNRAIGHGANPANSGTPGGGSGGAIYTDGDRYHVTVKDTVIRDNYAGEGGGAIFFVSNDNTGRLTIAGSTLHHNPSAVFWTRPYPGIYFHSSGHPQVTGSTIN
jgi:hypothetical protein